MLPSASCCTSRPGWGWWWYSAAVIYGTGRLLGVHEFPIAVAVLFALIIAMPLGIWLFGPLRRRATAGLEVATERRRRDREQLRARLRGEAPPDD